MPRLRRSNCAAPGIVRRRRGRGFEYLDPDGGRVDDPEVLERIGKLVIPPAWREVWVCMDPLGHLQATGVDAAGRKQYLCHERWRTHRDRRKFDSMVAFGGSLPRLRRRVASDLKLPRAGRQVAVGQLTEQRVLALAVRLLDLGFFRIGSEDYAERNESYGLTTMLREHVSVEEREVIFDFPAEEVNAYLKRCTGGEFTAKDFRTWNATVLAAAALAGPGGTEAKAQSRRRSAGRGRISRRCGSMRESRRRFWTCSRTPAATPESFGFGAQRL